MRASRVVYVLTLFLTAGLLLAVAPVRAETPLVDVLKANPEWFGTVDGTHLLAVTFRVSGDPGELVGVSYHWDAGRKREGIDFKLDDKNVEFMILPAWRKRGYELTLTSEGALEGQLTGLSKDGNPFAMAVNLEPVRARDAGPVPADRPSKSVSLKGSSKHCHMPPNFTISDGKKLAPELKKFLGFFSGYWGDNQLYHTLVISDVTPEGDAVTYYSHGTYGPWNIQSPRCGRHLAKIEDGVLTIRTVAGGKALVKYQFSDEDTLKATYDRNNRVTPGTFKRE